MGLEREEIIWPEYVQWTSETVLPGCIGLVVGLIYTGLHMVLSPEPGIGWLIARFVGILLLVSLLPNIIVQSVNVFVYLRWLLRIGNVTRWSRARVLSRLIPGRYEILRERPFRGTTSFGTYSTIGGWDSYVLRDKETGELSVLMGFVPKAIARSNAERFSN